MIDGTHWIERENITTWIVCLSLTIVVSVRPRDTLHQQDAAVAHSLLFLVLRHSHVEPVCQNSPCGRLLGSLGPGQSVAGWYETWNSSRIQPHPVRTCTDTLLHPSLPFLLFELLVFPFFVMEMGMSSLQKKNYGAHCHVPKIDFILSYTYHLSIFIILYFFMFQIFYLFLPQLRSHCLFSPYIIFQKYLLQLKFNMVIFFAILFFGHVRCRTCTLLVRLKRFVSLFIVELCN